MVSSEFGRFRERHRISDGTAMTAVERAALDTDYGACGYTGRAQALEIGEWLGLETGSLLLDLGSGSGWPGLLLAEHHGCTVVAADPAADGAARGAARARADGLAGRHRTVIADGTTMPFGRGVFDAIVHIDVLC